MHDKILESLFLDTALWQEVIEHGADKGVPQHVLERFQDPHGRAEMCREIATGEYTIAPPRTGYVPKDGGGERTFYANAARDRLLLHAIYKWLERNMSDMVHPLCLSYQEGIGIGRIVKKFAHSISSLSNADGSNTVGRKYDIHKYFDSVGRECIHRAFDAVEERYGHSSVIDVLRRYYDSDVYYDTRKGELVEQYTGLKQGCAVSSWLANVILYPLDEAAASCRGIYVRYSDDLIYVGDDYEQVDEIIRSHLSRVGLSLNEKKIEDVRGNRFVRFLGYNIRGGEIALSHKWVKSFQRDIDSITVKNLRLLRQVRAARRRSGAERERLLAGIMVRVQRRVSRYLYFGDGRFSWANHVLDVVNRKEDIEALNVYCLDAMRAVYTGKTRIGGLGVSPYGGIMRGNGRHVKANRAATAHLDGCGWMKGYLSMSLMQRAMSNVWLYRTLVADLLLQDEAHRYSPAASGNIEHDVDEMERLYGQYLNSKPDGRNLDQYYGRPFEDMTVEDLLRGTPRGEARTSLEEWVAGHIDFNALVPDTNQWYWQSEKYPQLVLLRKWFSA